MAKSVREAMTANPLSIDTAAVRVLAESGDPQSITVGEVASRDAITGAPEEDLEEALRLMAHHQVRRLPITEDDRI
jgi:CBS domain-containing protein